ncbi:hypothetical protein HanIR_Chr03g0129711 [Helianthus annuus]|nr:hypothetical protein HanIR_Chr03g0129711 [Helianthus annuus]
MRDGPPSGVVKVWIILQIEMEGFGEIGRFESSCGFWKRLIYIEKRRVIEGSLSLCVLMWWSIVSRRLGFTSWLVIFLWVGSYGVGSG